MAALCSLFEGIVEKLKTTTGEQKKWNPISNLNEDVVKFVEMHCGSLENASSRESVNCYEPADAGKMAGHISPSTYKEVACFLG